MRRLTLLASCLFSLPACDDEAPPPVEPVVTQALVECRPVDGVYTLSTVDFIVLDLDGAEDIADPIVVVEATRLGMARQVLAPDEAAEGGCRADACRVRFSWEYQRGETEQIYCGEGAEDLILEARIEAFDALGLVSRKLVGATAL